MVCNSFVTGSPRWCIFIWIQITLMRNYLLWREIQLVLKTTIVITHEDIITIVSKSLRPQTAEVCSNFLGKYQSISPRSCAVAWAEVLTVTSDRQTSLWPGKTGCHSRPWFAPTGIQIFVCISSDDCYRFNTDCCLAYLAIPALVLCLCPLPTRHSDLPGLLHTVLCKGRNTNDRGYLIPSVPF